MVILPVRFGLRKNYPSWSKRQPLKKLTRLEEFLSQRQENVTKQKMYLEGCPRGFGTTAEELANCPRFGKDFSRIGASQGTLPSGKLRRGSQGQAEAKVHLEELQFAQGLQETIRTLKQYRKQLMQLEQDLEIAQEALSEKQQAFEDVKAKKEELTVQSKDFLQKEEELETWKENIIYAQSLAQEQEKIKRSTTNYKQLEETYQQARKEVEMLNKSLSDLEANRLSLDSLHEAEKLFQIVGYSVENQLAQDLKEIENLNQELTKTEKRHQTLSFDIDQAQEILKELEEELRRTLVFTPSTHYCPTAGRVRGGASLYGLWCSGTP